jgi:hypothetical protein
MMTMDALLTQRHLAQTIGVPGGENVTIITEYPSPLRADSALIGTRPPIGSCQATAWPVIQERRQGRAVASGVLTKRHCAWAMGAV